jgi:hypothetical protein
LQRRNDPIETLWRVRIGDISGPVEKGSNPVDVEIIADGHGVAVQPLETGRWADGRQ